MRARFLKYAIAALVLIGAVGCSNEFWGGDVEPTPEEVVCDASLTLTISAQAEQTRAVAGAGTAAAGDKMNSLIMLLVRGDDDNTIEKRVDITSVASPTGFTNDTKSVATIKLDNVERGDHKIYLIANNPVDLSAYVVGANVATLGLDNLQLPTLSNNDKPSYTEEKGMPMTAMVEATFKQGNNYVSAEVERVVGRFGVTFYNHVVDEGYTVVVSNAELSAFNASRAYLFNHNYTVPSGNTYRPFFAAASGSQKIDHSGDLRPIDTYLYETDADDNVAYELSFIVGVFKNLAAGVLPTVGSSSTSVDETNHQAIIVGRQYLLYHPGRNRYLYMNGESLALDQAVPTTNYNNYLWEFSNQTGGKIKNVGTGRWISRSGGGDWGSAPSIGTTDSEGSAETFTKNNSDSNNTFDLRSSYTYNSSWGGGTYYYFLQGQNNNTISLLRGNSNATTTTDAAALWTLREMKAGLSWANYGGATLMADIRHSAPLTFINDLGSPVPLTQIKRNENLQVGVNIFYNPQLGDFGFDVVPWTSVNGDVTFD